MIIGIDASRSIFRIKKTGVEQVSDGLLTALLPQLDGHRVVFYTPELIEWLPADQQRVIPGRRFWTLFSLSWEMLKNKPDVFFSPVHELPFFLPAKTYRFIHDVAFKKNKRSYSFWQRRYLNFGLKRSNKLCQQLFVSTEQVKKDLLAYAGVSPDKIIVTGLGYNRQSRGGQGKKKNQIVYIGRIETKKNIPALLAGYQVFCKKHSDYSLVLAGKPGYGYSSIRKQIEQTAGVDYRGFVSEKTKLQLLEESQALLHLPQEEGFSYPLLEAFDSELPTVAADLPVLKEVGGDACLYVDPDNPGEIADNLEKVIFDCHQRTTLIRAGLRRLDKYSWFQVVTLIARVLSK